MIRKIYEIEGEDMNMKEKDYEEFRKIFAYLSPEDQFRMYKPLMETDKKLQHDVFKAISEFEIKHGDPIKWLKKNPGDFAIYKPIILGGISGKPSLIRGLIQIWKWDHL